MSLEAKKWNLVQLISSIDNEDVIDQLSVKIIQLIPNDTKELNENFELLSKYSEGIEQRLDLSKLIDEQGFNGINVEKMNQLAKEADIEELLEMLD